MLSLEAGTTLGPAMHSSTTSEHAQHTRPAETQRDGRPLPEPGVLMGEHHEMAVWVYPIAMALGAWLVASPATLGYRSPALIWSDVASGLLVIVLAALARRPGGAWAAWGAVLVGVWLLFAPLVFWAPTAAAYLNDTLIGVLVIFFAILIPHGMPMPGPQVPAGWSYNPSTWTQRVPILALGLFGFFLSRYMAAYQLGHIPTAWDPFFGQGTERILTSEVSRMFPVSDAGLGASVYLLEVLMTYMGGPRRWRTMPWMVTFFGILVVPLGVTSIVLVIMQPLAVGTWCTVCLVAALAMLVMVPLTLDEVLAMLQFLGRSRDEGASLWRTFWLGGNQPEGLEARPTRPVDTTRPEAAVWGLSVPWTLVASAVLGAWLMAAPDVLGSTGPAASSDRVVGSLVVTVAMVAFAEVARPVRWLNVLFGAWLVAAPWLLGAVGAARWSDVVVGLLLVALSLPRGPVRDRYGGWGRYIV